MEIQSMTIEDYDAIFALWACTPGIGLNGVDDSREGIAKFLKRNPSTSFVARDAGVLAGTILCGHDGRRGYIYHTTVKPAFRGTGVGKALVKAALEALKAQGISKAALVALRTNDPGNGFWQHMGFEKRDDLYYRNISISTANH